MIKNNLEEISPREIKQLRDKLGLTKARFALALGVAPFTVLRWEAGRTKPLPICIKMMRALEKKVLAGKSQRKAKKSK